MKRKALLIGNTSGLPGVKHDLERFSRFLQSNRGGAWRPGEIVVMVRPSLADLKRTITQTKLSQPDYVVVMFSGHGGYRRSTQLEINRSGDLIDERELQELAPRQLNIYDCCRDLMTETVQKSMEAAALALDSASGVRQKYDDRIMQAAEQQALLYSCRVGESSIDTGEGALYLGELLASARTVSYANPILTVGEAHEYAMDQLEKKQAKQHPDSRLDKHLTARQLVFAMNP
ncbi:caspase family protein [Paraburkholderia sp. BR14263]|uniref:caspase family protein n=1 Tax=unclassified Paraburkholderia TaxID=2615204 RepID=UPI0034CEE2C4